MKMRTILPLALILALLTGCAEDEATTLDVSGGEPMAFCIAQDAQTRAVNMAGTAWEGGEEVAVSIGGVVKKYVVGADKTTLSPASGVTPFTWTSKTETKTVTAWYPYADTKPAVTVPADQVTETKLRAAIMLEATVTNAPYGAIALPFTHRTAKVTIRPLDMGNANAMHADVIVTLKNLSGVSGGLKNITPLRNADNSYTAIIAPQTIADGTVFATIDDPYNKWDYKPGATTFAAARAYTYNVSYALVPPALGDLYYSDGTYSSTLVAGKTPIGVIAYLGTDAFTETGTNVGGSTFTGHGLVLCLKNAASNVCWSTETVSKFSGQVVMNADGLKRTMNVSGYTNTATLTVDAETAAKYPAAAAARNYAGLAAPATGTTGWFLPSAQQWVRMMTGLGGLAEGDITWMSWFNNDHSAATAWETAMAKAGAKGTAYDSVTDDYLWYWSSSEYSAYSAVYLYIDATKTGTDYGFDWSYADKDYSYPLNRVRPVLAF